MTCTAQRNNDTDNTIFNNKRGDFGIMSIPISNDPIRPRGRPSNGEIECRKLGIQLKDELKKVLFGHNIIRPSSSLYNQS